jgi:hypothetical protein
LCISWWFSHYLEDKEKDRGFPFEPRGLVASYGSLDTEMTWLRWLLKDFGVSVTIPTYRPYQTIPISIARDSVKHELTKHIGVDASFALQYMDYACVASIGFLIIWICYFDVNLLGLGL